MDGETIKSFLVGLGFGVDEKSLKQFNDAIKSATLKVTAMAGAVSAAAAGIFASITNAAKGFEDMGYQLRIVAPAMNRWLVMRQAMLEAYSHAGVNLVQTVKQAILFNYALAKMKFTLEAVYKSVAAKFFPILTKQLDIFRLKIYANMPKIQSALVKFVNFIFKAFQAVVELGTRLWSILTRVYDFFERLHKATDGWSTIILGVIAAWQLLNLAFLATPLGAIIGGLTTLLALFDDFKVWQEGGKSLFDWGPFVPVINAVADAFSKVKEAIGDMFTVLFNVVGLFKDLFTFNFDAFAIDIDNTFDAATKAIQSYIGYLKSLLSVGSSVMNWGGAAANWVGNHIGGGSSAAVGAINSPQPLLPQGAGGNSAKISQQTTITVNGAADANQVGKNVVGNQDRVNFDMTRNLKGAMQ